MNVELITKEDFNQFKAELFKEIQKFVYHSQRENKSKTWLKSKEVTKLLGISVGTLQNLRVNGTLPFSKIGGILYYKYEDILKLMNSQTDTD